MNETTTEDRLASPSLSSSIRRSSLDLKRGEESKARTKAKREEGQKEGENKRSSNTLRRYATYILLLLFFSSVKFLFWHFFFSSSPIPSASSSSSSSRHLLALNDDVLSSDPGEDEEDERCYSKMDQYGGLALYLFGILYTFVGLSVLCEGRFRESLSVISSSLKLPEDVAGATFMAAGTSSPELFTSLVAVFGPQDDIGVGTIVGSVNFNILFTIGSAALLCGRSHLLIEWKPVTRDAFFNFICFIYLLGVFYDEQVVWYEAVVGVMIYVVYVMMMVVNKQLMLLLDVIAEPLRRFFPSYAPADPDLLFKEGLLQDHKEREYEEDDDSQYLDDVEMIVYDEEGGHVNVGPVGRISDSPRAIENELQRTLQKIDDPLSSYDEEDEDGSRLPDLSEQVVFPSWADDRKAAALQFDEDLPAFARRQSHSHSPTDLDGSPAHESSSPSSVLGWIWLVLSSPYVFAFRLTIPPSRGRFQNQYLLSFAMCLVWLMVLTVPMVKWTEIIGCILHVDDAIMGVTFLAIGASMSDCLSSVFVARGGQGTMAISNALGSIVFDIVIALCVPWTVSIIKNGSPILVHDSMLVIDTIIMFASLSVMYLLLLFRRWKMDKITAIVLYILYAAFVIYSIIRETRHPSSE